MAGKTTSVNRASEDHKFPHSMGKLRRLRMDIVGLSEMRLASSKITSTYY